MARLPSRTSGDGTPRPCIPPPEAGDVGNEDILLDVKLVTAVSRCN